MKRINKTLATFLGTVLLAASAQAAWTLIDNFDSLTPGNIGGQHSWGASATNASVVLDPAGGPNQVLAVRGASQDVWKPLPTPIANGSSGTVFLQFRQSGEKNFNMGLSDTNNAATTTAFDRSYVNMSTAANNLLARDDAAAPIMTNSFANPPVALDSWHSLWYVIDNAADTTTFYLDGEVLKTTATPPKTALAFRGGAGAYALNEFFIKTFVSSTGQEAQNGTLYVDNIYMDPTGANLANPASTTNGPTLLITRGAPGFATVSWTPATPGLVLQVSDRLTPPAWTNAPSGSTNPVTLPAPPSARFYRLIRDTSAPSTPTNVAAAVISSSQINLSWTASTSAIGIGGYRIYRGGAQIATSVANSYSDTGLVYSTPYAYTVSAYDKAGTSSPQSTTLRATTLAPANVSFFGDWEAGLVTGSGNHNWINTFINSGSSITILHDGGARQGTNYARVIVADSGVPPNQGYTERAEVTHMQDAGNHYIFEDENTGTVRYTVSVKFDVTWQSMVGDLGGKWGMFLQLHSPDSLSSNPSFALNAPGNSIVLYMRAGDIDYNGGHTYTLSNAALNKGHWIDFIVTVKYAKYNTGFVTIQRRDEGQVDFAEVLNLQNVATVAWSSSRPTGNHWWDFQYMRHGLYRNHETFTSILYIDGFTRTVLGP